ncbi:hypothetical protein EVAR_73550_1, partial [Eumeta japonica]
MDFAKAGVPSFARSLTAWEVQNDNYVQENAYHGNEQNGTQ